jgi:serine phosphatase RsbU (regulator of sigma subunit)
METQSLLREELPDTRGSHSDRITRAIFEHAARISREQEIAGLVRLNADFARDLAEADRCSLWLVDRVRGELWTKIAHGLEPMRIPLGEGLVGACVREDQVLLVNDTSKEPRWLRSIDDKSGYHTAQVLCVPLRAEGRVIGALQLLNKPSGFTEEDAGLLGLLAHFAASAIESERLRQAAEGARLLQHELDLARDVQSRLLPGVCDAVEGIECAGFCRPAKFVGGDYYDLIPLRHGGFAFTLGDVSGKGVPAAVMMASIQTLLRSLLERDVDSLAPVVADLNRALYASSTAERYSTLFCGCISDDHRWLSYVNAGHIAPMLVHRDGTMEQLDGAGLPVGMMPDSTYDQNTVRLREGDLLVVVSDGIMEVCNADGEFWDEECVASLVREHGEEPVAGLAARLCKAADGWAAGAEQYDDMTVVAVRVS